MAGRKEEFSDAVRTRIDGKEKAALSVLAGRLGETPSRVIRRLIREAINGETDLFDPGLEVLAGATNQLAAVGRNLNQIARAVNEGRVMADPVSSEQMTEIMAQVSALDNAFRDVIGTTRSRKVRARKLR